MFILCDDDKLRIVSHSNEMSIKKTKNINALHSLLVHVLHSPTVCCSSYEWANQFDKRSFHCEHTITTDISIRTSIRVYTCVKLSHRYATHGTCVFHTVIYFKVFYFELF